MVVSKKVAFLVTNCRPPSGILRNFVTNIPKSSIPEYDIVVVGGGIVGAASAREVLKRHPKLRMAIVEKESKLAAHQSGHNSGVIHAGIYYKPGTLKAKLCVQGLKLMYQYCDEKKVPYKKVGKLIVATDATEVQRLDELVRRAKENQVEGVSVVDEKGIKEIEPHCRGIKAIHSPNTGIVDFRLVTEQYVKDFREFGGQVHLDFEVTQFQESQDASYPVRITSKDGQTVKSKYVLTCGGLYSDKLSEMTGCPRQPRIIPFRGEYLLLSEKLTHLIRGNIYPVPDPRFPFLGVHITPRMDGSVWLGPNAVLAFKREGYKWSDINLFELADALTFPGFWRLAVQYVSYGCKEMVKSAFPGMQVKDLQKFVPELTKSDVRRGPSGVRAQALDYSGNLVDDFYFDKGVGPLGKLVLHCRNAPSPGATSSLAIANMMADRMKTEFQLT